MHHAFKKPALAQAKNELTLLRRIRPAPVAELARLDSNFLIPRPIAMLEVQATV